MHRNWLAITHSLPLSKWYYEATSEWTLDYPPFFAWFEYALSFPALLFDKEMLKVSNLNYDSQATILFQRLSVIFTELVLVGAVLRYFKSSDKSSPLVNVLVSLLCPGLLYVDHIHFQYNGFLFSILVWSILYAKRGNYLMSGLLYSALLNFKHIYIYIAPAYFVFLLRAYCMEPQSLRINFKRLFLLGSIVLSVFAISFGPFVYLGQLDQVLKRLFPFKRGLCHAYWAANFWAIYSFLDRILVYVFKIIKPKWKFNGVSSTQGLVGEASFAILPEVPPLVTFLLTFLFMLPYLIRLWKDPRYVNFVMALVSCAYSSFMFGWHVHEKAILLVTIPLALIIFVEPQLQKPFFFSQLVGSFALFPLLINPEGKFCLKLF